MSISITPLKMAVLEISGTSWNVRQIGQGRYTKAWKGTQCGLHACPTCSPIVWLQVHESDYSKDILAHLTESESQPNNPHLPKVTRMGWIGETGYRLYRSILYRPLTAQHKEAWTLYKHLHTLWESTRTAVNVATHHNDPNVISQTGKELFRAAVEEFMPNSLILDAIERLINESYNYNAYCIEITKKNCAVDSEGNLVLLDPLFDLADVIGKRREVHARYY